MCFRFSGTKRPFAGSPGAFADSPGACAEYGATARGGAAVGGGGITVVLNGFPSFLQIDARVTKRSNKVNARWHKYDDKMEH